MSDEITPIDLREVADECTHDPVIRNHLRGAADIIEALRAANARLQAWHDAVMGQEVVDVIPPDFYGYVWDYDNPEDSNEDTFAEYLHNACDQECGPILGMERRVMIARKLPDVLLTVTEVDEDDRPKSWSVTIIRPQPLAKE